MIMKDDKKRKSLKSPVAMFVDAMERIYPDRIPFHDPEAGRLDAIRGGCVAVAVAVSGCSREYEVKLNWEGYGTGAGKNWPKPRIFTLKSVQVPHNTIVACKQVEWRDEAAANVIRRAPFRVLEAMWPCNTIRLAAGETGAFLLMWEISPTAKPGAANFALTVSGAGIEEHLTGSLRIHAVTLEVQHLNMVNWWSNDRVLRKYPSIGMWSEEHWKLIEKGLYWLHAGRQTDVVLPFMEHGGNLVDVSEPEPNRFVFDFARMDRFANLALKIGFRTLLGGHLCSKKFLPDGLDCDLSEPQLHLRIPRLGGNALEPQLPIRNERARSFLKQFLKALQTHLKENGWLDIWRQHIADEPFSAVSESYCETCELVREWWPGMKLIDAASHCAAGLALDIPVPEIDGLELHKTFFRRMREQMGKQVWLYTCCCPAGAWANRFLDFHLNKGLLLPWFCDHYGCTGYLHWGGNQWGYNDLYEDPGFQGDGFILMPGPDGPVPTLRWLALRMGIEDYECLQLLRSFGSSGSEKADELRRRLITGPTDYRYDVPIVRAVRREMHIELCKRGEK